MQIDNIEPEKLFLDCRNPRFGLSEAADEAEALKILLDTADLRELWNSISVRGFEKFEPLVATQENGKLIVIEGNRRLAAVKLLLQPDLLAKEAPRKKAPEIEPDKLETCKKLPVVVVADRQAAAGYIGFKHVNGPTRWSSLAKARFGVRFYEGMEGRLTDQERMQSLTKQFGDTRSVILRLLVAYKIVQQSANLGHFDRLSIDEKTIDFSHLYTLINNPDSRDFIGLPRAPLKESLIKENPIPEAYHEQLFEIMGWLYGDNSVIKAQGTDRPRLQRVLGSKEGIKELRLTGDLEDAESVAGLKNQDWLGLLANARKTLQKVAGEAVIVVDNIEGEDLANAHSLLARLDKSLKQIKAVIPEPSES